MFVKLERFIVLAILLGLQIENDSAAEGRLYRPYIYIKLF